jgi:hypothetical protein
MDVAVGVGVSLPQAAISRVSSANKPRITVDLIMVEGYLPRMLRREMSA